LSGAGEAEAEANVRQAVPSSWSPTWRPRSASTWTAWGSKPEGKLGLGVSICFVCKDALAIYSDAKARGVAVQTPFVGNAMWVTSLSDPDGYRIDFESSTDVSEEAVYSE
jgi:hypothetical protein